MNATTLTRIIQIEASFETADDYKDYLHQLVNDHKESGTLTTAEDYMTFIRIINSFEKYIVTP